MRAYLTPLLKNLTSKCTLRNTNLRVNDRFQGVNYPLMRLIWTNDDVRKSNAQLNKVSFLFPNIHVLCLLCQVYAGHIFYLV